MNEKKIRSGRVTKQQREKLLQIMRGNRQVALGQFAGTNSAKATQEVWKSVAEELNAAGGACKTPEQWKKSWADWKVAVKKQHTAIKRFQNATGNRPASEGPAALEGLDAEMLEFFPAATVDGDGVTVEAGFVDFEVFFFDMHIIFYIVLIKNFNLAKYSRYGGTYPAASLRAAGYPKNRAEAQKKRARNAGIVNHLQVDLQQRLRGSKGDDEGAGGASKSST